MIFRKLPNVLTQILELFWPPTYPVYAFYRAVQSELASDKGMEYPDIIEKGKGNPVAGVPTWYRLSDAWRISKSDLKMLAFGPLVQVGKELVPAHPPKLLARIWRVIKILSILGGAVTLIQFLILQL